MNRSSKQILIGATLAAVSGATLAADLTVSAFGGLWEKSLRECVISRFEAATGKTVDVVLGSPAQWLNQIAASPGKPPLDIVYMPSENAVNVIERGLAEKFTAENLPVISELAPYFAEIGGGYGVVHNYGSMGILYNKQTVKNPPTSWDAFVKGTIAGDWVAAIPSINYTGTLNTVLWNFAKQQGSDEKNIQPGLNIVKAMQDSGNLSFWSDPNQVLNAMKTGEYDLAMYWDGRAWAFIDDGNTDTFDYLSPTPGAVASMTWIQVIKNADPLAMQFVRTALDKEAQSCFGSATRYGVGNAQAKFDPTVAHQITQFDQLAFPPFLEITKHQNAWIESWNKQIGR